VVALALAAVLLAACAKADDPGVTVKGFDDDLVFGVTEEGTVAPNVPGEGAVDPSALTGDVSLPDQVFSTPAKRVSPAVARPRPQCPEADTTAFPEEPAPLSVPTDRRPKVGRYSWRRTGSLQSAATNNAKLSIDGYEERVVRTIVEKGPSTNTKSLNVPGSTAEPGVIFTYETVQPDVNGNVVVSVFQVDTSPLTAYQDAAATDVEVRGGGPERGVVLKSYEILDRQGSTLSEFVPATGLLLLPLPVRAGEDFTSSAIDTRTGDTVTFQGEVLDRTLVDACGDLVEAWQVTGTQTFAGNETISRTYQLVVATGLGGIPVQEKIDQTIGGELHLTSTIAQLVPDPLPGT
jgi:hypothetical protein